MDMFDSWYAIPEVYAIEDKLKAGCISMQVSVDCYGFIAYDILCKFEGAGIKYLLLNKLAKVAQLRKIRGRFIMQARDYYGNTIKQVITT